MKRLISHQRRAAGAFQRTLAGHLTICNASDTAKRTNGIPLPAVPLQPVPVLLSSSTESRCGCKLTPSGIVYFSLVQPPTFTYYLRPGRFSRFTNSSNVF